MKQTFTTTNQVKVGDTGLNFKAVDGEVKDFNLSDLKGKKKVILSIPSIDTGVCELQTKKFNEKVSQMEGVELIVVSLDLPFAQQRWCAANNGDNITMLSDYKYGEFGANFGLKLDTLGLLGRAVIIIDETDTVSYVEICENVPDHPNYDEAFKALGL